jgi:hypothetical protein
VSGRAIGLRLQEQTTLLEFEDGRTATLQVGPQGLADTELRHDPPTPAELERAIDRVEDALSGLHLASADGDRLVTTDAHLRTLPGLGTHGASLGRDAVEMLFQRLASRALGMPIPAAELPPGRETAAALLILRECMHHLGFDRVDAVPG